MSLFVQKDIPCYSEGNKHKFSPRYTEEWHGDGFSVGRSWGVSINELRSLYIVKKYVYDVCEWCGKVVRNGN